ncbi:chemerin-like receptor 1 [Rhinoderma darwinii]|uniref:chemerin-like receptor 1 n=1 Tax=Rhinoderma darwinii TaxID=43563 RepID=UPI003F66F497
MENITVFITLVNDSRSKYPDYCDNYSVIKNNVRGDNHQSQTYEGLCIMVIYSAFCLLGTIGNGLVIWFGIFRMKETVNVVWFLSLAIADFSFAFILPLPISQILLGYWPFEKYMCKLTYLLLSLNMCVSILQLTVISVDRCICVVFPVWCHNHRRSRLALIIVLIIWIISFALVLPSVMFIDMSKIYNRSICTFAIDKSRLIGKIILEFVILFLLPFVIIVSCYIVIVLNLRRKHIFRSSRPLKTIVAVIAAFFICWFPSHVFSLLLIFGSNFDHDAIYYGSLIAMVLIIMNTCINPILYVFIGRDFKEKICGSFQAMFEKAILEDEDKADFEKQERCIPLSNHGMNRTE